MNQSVDNQKENTLDADSAVSGQQAETPKIILVVDDELYQLRRAHVQNVATDFYGTISDITDPNFSSLWDVARAIPELGADAWDEDEASSYFASDVAVSTILRSEKFAEIAIPTLKQLLHPFTARMKRVEALKQVFLAAFPGPVFDLRFSAPPRPNLATVAQCEAVFLDLFLEQGEPSPVDAVQTYLRNLANEARTSLLPPLVLMSTHPELQQHKLRFSEKAGISAAGLMVLPKDKLMEPDFGAAGLNLAFNQLNLQRSVANAMRLFIGSWLGALDEAREKTAQTLWNLDASAMQQIHLASVGDDDPYDEHLNELLSRENLFHVESNPGVALTVAELDRCFREHLNDSGGIKSRLIAPLTDINTARSFMSHFTWLGSPPGASFYSDEQNVASKISRALPFGSVLCSGDPANGNKCFIHITQQCDLNGISRDRVETRSVTFAIADLIELRTSDNPIIKTSDLVAKNLRIVRGDIIREFDLHVNIGELLALPLRELVQKAKSEDWRVVGRLRSDITNHIVAATTNQMSRPASQKMIRPALLHSKVFLQSASLTDGRLALIDTNSAAARKPAKIFSLSLDENKFSFQDDACIEIALWLAHHSSTIGLRLDAASLFFELSRGWRDGADLPGGLKVRVKECADLSTAFRVVLPGDINGDGAQLTIVCCK